MSAIHEIPWARWAVLLVVALTASTVALAQPAAAAAAVPAAATVRAVLAPASTSWHGTPIRRVQRRPFAAVVRHDGDRVLLSRGAGMRSPCGSRRVRTLQRRLRQLGYRPGPVDGRMGARTEGALRWFEYKHGFVPDGVVWSRVWAVLGWRAAKPGASGDRRPVAARAPERHHTARGAVIASAAARASWGRSALAAVMSVLAVVGALVSPGGLLLIGHQRRRSARDVVDRAAPAPVRADAQLTDRDASERRSDPIALTHPPQRQRDSAQGAPGRRLIGYLTLERDQRGTAAAELKQRTGELQAAAGAATLVRVVHDSEPGHGRLADRPGLAYALVEIASGRADGLIALTLASLSRSILDVEPLIRWFADHDRTLVVADIDLDSATATGRTVARALATVSASQRAHNAAMTRRGLDAARNPSAPAAVRDVPELHDRITDMRARGMTLQAIADTLNRERVPTLRGGSQWRPSSVQATVGYKRPTMQRLPTAAERAPREAS